MSKTRLRVVPEKTIKLKPKTRRCNDCRQTFSEDDVSQDIDDKGRSLGWFCGGCI